MSSPTPHTATTPSPSTLLPNIPVAYSSAMPATEKGMDSTTIAAAANLTFILCVLISPRTSHTNSIHALSNSSSKSLTIFSVTFAASPLGPMNGVTDVILVILTFIWNAPRQVRYNGWLTAKKPASPVQRMVDGKKAQLQQQHQPTPQQ
ncbi:hypothetical protein ACH5RR_025219 [Cinchona calisaya]|uniref:Uncharacterized protein n=1 Tax=Cinchona calisaya TaxID=153742 RepID=A0ABD2YZ00_9GENT